MLRPLEPWQSREPHRFSKTTVTPSVRNEPGAARVDTLRSSSPFDGPLHAMSDEHTAMAETTTNETATFQRAFIMATPGVWDPLCSPRRLPGCRARRQRTDKCAGPAT